MKLDRIFDYLNSLEEWLAILIEQINEIIDKTKLNSNITDIIIEAENCYNYFKKSLVATSVSSELVSEKISSLMSKNEKNLSMKIINLFYIHKIFWKLNHIIFCLHKIENWETEYFNELKPITRESFKYNIEKDNSIIDIDSFIWTLIFLNDELRNKVNKQKKDEYQINVNETLLLEIIEELIKNAKKAWAKNITIDDKIHDWYCNIILEDNWEWFPDWINIKEIFEPWFSDKKQNSSGCGLWLYLIRAVIEEMFNGKIEANNNKTSKWATFVIKLPIVNQ